MQVMAGESERRADIAFLLFHNTDQHSSHVINSTRPI